ncbi:hypothetical protein MMC10_006000 [Thelotrema lepadinum]|nr:hypothetical protein [Thelotrema lepadinum]
MSMCNILPPHLTRYISRGELTEFLEEEYGDGIDFCIQVRKDAASVLMTIDLYQHVNDRWKFKAPCQYSDIEEKVKQWIDKTSKKDLIALKA